MDERQFPTNNIIISNDSPLLQTFLNNWVAKTVHPQRQQHSEILLLPHVNGVTKLTNLTILEYPKKS